MFTFIFGNGNDMILFENIKKVNISGKDIIDEEILNYKYTSGIYHLSGDNFSVTYAYDHTKSPCYVKVLKKS